MWKDTRKKEKKTPKPGSADQAPVARSCKLSSWTAILLDVRTLVPPSGDGVSCNCDHNHEALPEVSGYRLGARPRTGKDHQEVKTSSTKQLTH